MKLSRFPGGFFLTRDAIELLILTQMDISCLLSEVKSEISEFSPPADREEALYTGGR